MIAGRDELLSLAEWARSIPNAPLNEAVPNAKNFERIAIILESFAGPTPPPVLADGGVDPIARSCIIDGEVGVIELDDPRVVGAISQRCLPPTA
jgi:hypothetical protein